MCQGAAIDVFQFATQRHAVGQTRRPHVRRTRKLRQIVRRGFAFHGGVGGDDHFLDLAFAQALGQAIETELFRAQAIERRQTTQQHEVLAAKAGGLFDGGQFGGRLHHAQHLAIAAAAGAQVAHRRLAEIAAARAVADLAHGLLHHLGQALAAFAVALQQMEGHTLRTLAAHAGQATQRFDEVGE